MARTKIQKVAQDLLGNVVPGASVQVNVRGGGPASVYATSNPADLTTLTNPVTTDGTDGSVPGWLAPGSYDLVYNSKTYPIESADGVTASKWAWDGSTLSTSAPTTLTGSLDLSAATVTNPGGAVYATLTALNNHINVTTAHAAATNLLKTSDLGATVQGFFTLLQSLGGLTGADNAPNRLPFLSNTNTFSTTPISSFIRSSGLLNAADANAAQSAIGGPFGGGGAVSSVAGKTGAVTLVESDIASLTTDLGNKQGLDGELTALAAVTSAADAVPFFTAGSPTPAATVAPSTAAARAAWNATPPAQGASSQTRLTGFTVPATPSANVPVPAAAIAGGLGLLVLASADAATAQAYLGSAFFINVRAPGSGTGLTAVDGTGATDIRANLQAIIDYAAAQVSGSSRFTVFFPPGLYLLDSTLTIVTTGGNQLVGLAVPSNCHLLGVQGAHIKVGPSISSAANPTGAAMNSVVQNADPTLGNDNILIEGLDIDANNHDIGNGILRMVVDVTSGIISGSNTGVNSITAAASHHCNNIIVRNCRVHGQAQRTISGQVTSGQGLKFRNVLSGRIEDNYVYTTGQDGIFVVEDCGDISVTNNAIWNTGDDMIAIGATLLLSSGAPGSQGYKADNLRCERVNVANNICGDPTNPMWGGGAGITAKGVRDVVIDGNVIYGPQGHGIAVGNGDEGNRDNTDDTHIHQIPGQMVTVTDNIIDTPGAGITGSPARQAGSGISLVTYSRNMASLANVTVEGNVIRDPLGYGIALKTGHQYSAGAVPGPNAANITNVLIKGNQVEWVDASGAMAGARGIGSWIGATNTNGSTILTDVICEGNLVDRAPDDGINFAEAQAKRIQLHNNHVTDAGQRAGAQPNGSAGIRMDNSWDADVQGNHSYCTAAGSTPAVVPTQQYGIRATDISYSLILLGNQTTCHGLGASTTTGANYSAGIIANNPPQGFLRIEGNPGFEPWKGFASTQNAASWLAATGFGSQLWYKDVIITPQDAGGNGIPFPKRPRVIVTPSQEANPNRIFTAQVVAYHQTGGGSTPYDTFTVRIFTLSNAGDPGPSLGCDFNWAAWPAT